jgi:histidine triad (HIT) family protein
MIPLAIRRLLIHAYGKIMMKTSGCIFCRVMARELPATVLYEDDRCVVIEDVHPVAPVHVLIIPRKHIATLKDAEPDEEGLLGHLLLVAARMAEGKNIVGRGFRTVINTNAGAGQTIYHMHVHVLGGRTMRWPPG